VTSLPRFRFPVTSRRFWIRRHLGTTVFCVQLLLSKHSTTGSGRVLGQKFSPGGLFHLWYVCRYYVPFCWHSCNTIIIQTDTATEQRTDEDANDCLSTTPSSDKTVRISNGQFRVRKNTNVGQIKVCRHYCLSIIRSMFAIVANGLP